MLINASHPEENRVAIVVDGILSELDIEIAGQEQSKGNIYKAVVVRVETGLQAAFVDYGAEKLGFLQIGEIHPNLYPAKDDSKGRPRIADILKRGQEILVQIVKEERGNKGAALTTFLSIPGRYMVLMPDSTTKGVSRKISDDAERKKLKKTMAELDLPERMGYIVRTAGIGKDKDELKRDFDYLVRLFEGITARKDQIKAPAQLYQESNLAIRSIRDYFTTDIDEVLIDDPTVYQDAKDFFALVMPELSHLVKQHRERRPIFSRYQIEEQIDALAKNQIPLPSGGSIVIDQTEALVAIDVNSGKMASESGIEATALKTNREAAAEIGRQLRLRDLGGLVVIDFIDMRDRKNIREVEVELRKALKNDKAKVSVGRISQFGLLEMSRQRLKPVLSVGSFVSCPHCKGAGKIKSAEAQAVALLRQIHTAASKGHIAYIDAKVPVDVANYLLNQKRSTITELERQLALEITIYGSDNLLPGDIEVESSKKEKDQDDGRNIVPISHANQIEVALAAQQEEDLKTNGSDDETSAPPEGVAATDESAPEPAKKKRRRRRRKPAGAASADKSTTPGEEQENKTADAQISSDPEEPATETEPAAASETDSRPKPEAPQEQSSDSDSADEVKKPRRRSRRPARRKPAKPSEQPAAEGVADSAEQQDSTASETQKQDKDSENVPAEASSQQAAETNPAAESSTETEAAKPKRKTRRAPAKARETRTETTAPEAPAAETSVDTAEEEKPKRRTRRAPAKTRATKTETTAPEAPAAETSVDTAEEEKPKRRTRRAPAKTRATKTETTAPEAPAAETSVDTAEEEKPKRRTRRTPAKTRATKTETTAPEAPAAETSVDTAEEEKPKRRTRRTPAKTRETKTETSAPEAEKPADSAEEEKPKRRTRRTSTKAKKETATQSTQAESTPPVSETE